MPKLLSGGVRHKVETVSDFEQALKKALTNRGTFHLIEIVMDKLDFSNAAKRFSQVAQMISPSLNLTKHSKEMGNSGPGLPPMHHTLIKSLKLCVKIY